MDVPSIFGSSTAGIIRPPRLPRGLTKSFIALSHLDAAADDRPKEGLYAEYLTADPPEGTCEGRSEPPPPLSG